jgi:hypothetical protein
VSGWSAASDGGLKRCSSGRDGTKPIRERGEVGGQEALGRADAVKQRRSWVAGGDPLANHGTDLVVDPDERTLDVEEEKGALQVSPKTLPRLA